MTDAPPPQLAPLDDLVDVLTLRELGTVQMSVTGLGGEDAAGTIGATSARVFEGRSQPMPHRRVFGGQVLAQCVMAAGLTVRDLEADHGPRPIHSLHGYFMRPGDDRMPIRFAVEEMRDGHSFSTRRVHAIQNGKPIMSTTCSFQTPTAGLEHQDRMPTVPGPDGLPTFADLLAGNPAAALMATNRPIEQRAVEPDQYLRRPNSGVGEDERGTTANFWLRAIGKLPDDPLLHAAVLAYGSDYSLLEPIMRRHDVVFTDPRLRIASLDHAMWFHRPVRADEWVLYAQNSPSASNDRGLGIGRMFTEDGTLVATVAQEGMVRLKTD